MKSTVSAWLYQPLWSAGRVAVAVTDGEELDLTPKPGAEEPLLPDEAGE